MRVSSGRRAAASNSFSHSGGIAVSAVGFSSFDVGAEFISEEASLHLTKDERLPPSVVLGKRSDERTGPF
jgi:hypothetical protein